MRPRQNGKENERYEIEGSDVEMQCGFGKYFGRFEYGIEMKQYVNKTLEHT